jgi:CTP:phosphocholine cytidylyltransferase-like protein
MSKCGIIPAAGKGTRFGELSKRYPKCTLPYKNKPIIIHNIEWLHQNGCDEVILVLNYGSEQIRSIVDFYDFNFVKYVTYEVDDGVAGSVLAGAKETDAEQILIILSDLVTESRISPNQMGSPFLGTQEVEDTSRWCCYDEHDGIFYDKDPNSPVDVALSGIYNIPDRKTFVTAGVNVSGPHDTEFQLSEILSEYQTLTGNTFWTWQADVIDFGTLPEFLKNRGIGQGRAFNTLEFDNQYGLVTKLSDQAEKVYREYTWFMNAPISFQRHLPKVYTAHLLNDETGYTMERVDLPTLRDLYVYVDNSPTTWERISSDCLDVLTELKDHEISVSSEDYWKGVISKTKGRLSGLNVNPMFVYNLEVEISKYFQSPLNFYHDDLCFSNMFYDINSRAVKLIDPRGEYYGNWLYDLAKLNHSFAGLYDVVDTEMYVVSDTNVRLYCRGKSDILERWNELLLYRFGYDIWRFIQLLTASLFYSMIPLHYHNHTNQKIFKYIGDQFYELWKSDTMETWYGSEDLIIPLEKLI